MWRNFTAVSPAFWTLPPLTSAKMWTNKHLTEYVRLLNWACSINILLQQPPGHTVLLIKYFLSIPLWGTGCFSSAFSRGQRASGWAVRAVRKALLGCLTPSLAASLPPDAVTLAGSSAPSLLPRAGGHHTSRALSTAGCLLRTSGQMARKCRKVENTCAAAQALTTYISGTCWARSALYGLLHHDLASPLSHVHNDITCSLRVLSFSLIWM